MSLKRRNDLACPFPKFSLALVVCLAIHCARSQPADTLEKDSKVNPRKIPLEASLTNGSVIFSWPVQTKPTEFQAQEAGSDEWKAVPESSFHTNKSVVSVTLPVGEKAVLYRVKHPPFAHRSIPAPSLAGLPMPPAVSTNRASRPKTSKP